MKMSVCSAAALMTLCLSGAGRAETTVPCDAAELTLGGDVAWIATANPLRRGERAIDLEALARPVAMLDDAGRSVHLGSDGLRLEVAALQDGGVEHAVGDDGAAAPITGPHSHAYHTNRPDAHAPIGVMGDHLHAAGEVMLSYRYMHMRMAGSRDGTNELTNAEVLDDFIITPTRMTMEMHMFGVMYAPTDWLTAMVMVPYVRNAMDHQRRDGLTFRTSSEGLGDVKLSGLFALYGEGRHRLHGTIGVSLPTGDIDAKDQTPLGRAVLPYPMQLGSGTFDLLLGATYVYQADQWSAGGQVNGVIRLGENDADYTLGDRVNATGWFACKLADFISASTRISYEAWGDIDGRDERITQFVGAAPLVPTAFPDLRGGQRLDILFGVNLLGTEAAAKGHRLGLELGIPVWQDLDGPQLETDWYLTLGWQFAF